MARPLSEVTAKQQIRLGLQGYSGVGKTWAALTFPNPIVLNLDRGLGAHAGRADVIEIPFYKPELSGKKPGELKDKLIEWGTREGSKLSEEQTLVFDGCTSLQNAYHAWYKVNQHMFLTKTNKIDDYAEWREKKNYFAELFELFKTFKCDVVFIAHESAQKDKETGAYTGKIRPLLTGAFNDEIINHCTDWFRCHSADKPADYSSLKPEALAAWGVKTHGEFKAMCDEFPRNTTYYWQLEGDSIFDGKASSLVNFPRYIPAGYKHFAQYMRGNQNKPNQTK